MSEYRWYGSSSESESEIERKRDTQREHKQERHSQLQTYINRLPKTALDRNRQRGSRQTDIGRQTEMETTERKTETAKENVKQTETGR